MLHTLYTWNSYTLAPCLPANTFDGDSFALIGAHQHCITMHNQGLMRERQRGGGVIYHLSRNIIGRGGEETLLGGGASSVLNKNVQ